MPVIRPTNWAEPFASLREPLVDALAKELRGSPVLHGPVIFEMPSGAGPNRIDVIVAWDAWEGLKPEERASIIRSAYERYSRELNGAIHYIDPAKAPAGPIGPRLTSTVIGATREGAISEGLLPYRVQPQIEEGEDIDELLLRHLIREAGGIETSGGLQLRLPTAELAADALAQVSEVMPEAHWAIIEDPSRFED